MRPSGPAAAILLRRRPTSHVSDPHRRGMTRSRRPALRGQPERSDPPPKTPPPPPPPPQKKNPPPPPPPPQPPPTTQTPPSRRGPGPRYREVFHSCTPRPDPQTSLLSVISSCCRSWPRPRKHVLAIPSESPPPCKNVSRSSPRRCPVIGHPRDTPPTPCPRAPPPILLRLHKHPPMRSKVRPRPTATILRRHRAS